MSNQQHTPEPLHYMPLPAADGTYMVLGGQGQDYGLVASCTTEEDARRIAACVNACAGIETSSLEAINKHGVTLRQKLAGAQDQMIELEKQRDLLLSVLEKAFSALESCTPGDFATGHVIYPSFDESLVADAYCEAESVIASVRGAA